MTIDSSNTAAAAAAAATSMIDPDGLNNTLVAESDFAAARQALLDFAETKRERANHNNNNVDVDAATTITEIHTLVSHSLLDHLQAAVRPVTDEAFHLYCHELQKNEPNDDDNDNKEEAMDENEKKKEKVEDDDDDDDDDDDSDNNSYGNDWQDWINQDTLERVRTLRQQVRDQAEKVGQVREKVLEQAVSLARRRCCACSTSAAGSSSTSTSTTSMNLERSGIENTPAENNKMQAAYYDQKVVEMQESMQRMKQTLAKVEKRLPESVSLWQETLDTVEIEGERAVLSQQQQQPLSQVEQAIMEREDDEIDNDDDAVMDDGPLSAEERLARFVARSDIMMT